MNVDHAQSTNTKFFSLFRPGPREIPGCTGTCQFTFCSACYFSEEPRPLPGYCPLCGGPISSVRCYKRWAYCIGRADAREYEDVSCFEWSSMCKWIISNILMLKLKQLKTSKLGVSCHWYNYRQSFINVLHVVLLCHRLLIRLKTTSDAIAIPVHL